MTAIQHIELTAYQQDAFTQRTVSTPTLDMTITVAESALFASERFEMKELCSICRISPIREYHHAPQWEFAIRLKYFDRHTNKMEELQ